MSFCAHCVQGVRHEGTPEGTFVQIADVNCYVATPTGEYAQDKVIIYIPDVFGVQLQNNRLLADDFARNGFKVVLPDIFHDAAPETAFTPGSTFDIQEWFPRNGVDVTEPKVRAVLAALKAGGVTRVASLGFCYGARSSFNLAFENAVNVVAVSHPSLLSVPADFEKYVAESKAPLLINSCEVDPQLPIPSQQKADEILGGGKFAPGYKRTYWEGCTHGFMVRGDPSDAKVKAGREGAFAATVQFLKTYL